MVCFHILVALNYYLGRNETVGLGVTNATLFPNKDWIPVLEMSGGVTFLYLFISGNDFSGPPHHLTQDLHFTF